MTPQEFHIPQGRLLKRFWDSASGFWRGSSAWRVRLLCFSAVAIIIAQLATQYRLNYWNRDFFNALDQKNRVALIQQILIFFPLVMISTGLALSSVWSRMTIQRKWRLYLTKQLISDWLVDSRYRSLGHLNGTDVPRNAEFRISEDARIATDAPIDITLALFSSILTAIIFFQILSNVGGSISFSVFETKITIPHYLAISVLIYSGVVTTAVLLIGRRLTSVIQGQMQAEAALRASANLVRESGEGILTRDIESEDRFELWLSLRNVIEQWRRLCWQLMRITIVTHANMLLAPAIGLLLCVPKYLAGDMTLGEVTQAAAAFGTVQGALNWFVDNFQRMSDWRSSALRVAALLFALDGLKQPPQAD